MAAITTRQTAGIGATVAGVPLTNTQLDQNFIRLNEGISNARANINISGGGTVAVDASFNVTWSQRFIVISNGRGATGATQGYWDITVPAVSTVITGVGGAANKTVVAAGIPLAAWEALYYILPLGQGSSSLAANFRVANYTADVDIPSNWILICVRNGDNGIVYFPHGANLAAGDSAVGYETNTNIANTLVSRDANGNFSANIITASLNGNASTVTNGVYLNGAQTLSDKTLTSAILTAYSETVTTATVSTTTYNIDLSLGNIFYLTLASNVTFTFTNPAPAGRSRPVTVILQQDATGGRTATFTGARYTEGQLPQLSTGANQIDMLSFFSTNGGSWYFGTFAMANVS